MFRYSIDEHLVLEHLAPHHEQTIFELRQNHHETIQRYQPLLTKVQTLFEVQDQLYNDFELLSTGKRWTWVLHKGDAIIGVARLTVSGAALNMGEITFWLIYDNTLLAQKILKTIVDYAMTELGVYRAFVQTPADSLLAQVALMSDFEHEAILRHAARHDDVWYDLSIYAALATDWIAYTHPIFAHHVDGSTSLRLQEIRHVLNQYELVHRNLPYLKPWFDWLDDTYTLHDEQIYTHLRLQAYGWGKELLVSIWHEQQVVGSVNLTINRAQRQGELGYWLDAAQSGKGIATKSVQVLINYGFVTLKLNRIWLRAATDNTPSRKLAERVGMMQEAILRHDAYVAGRWVDHVVYSILAND